MADNEIEAKYYEMLASGDLTEMFPYLTGDWKKDKSEFSTFWRQNEMIFEDDDDDLDIDLDNEYY